MSSFTDPLVFKTLFGRRFVFLILVAKPFTFYVGDNEHPTEFYTVPASAIIELPIFSPKGKYAKAAVLHRFLIESNKISREHADSVFLLAMEVLKVPLWKRKAIYFAVSFYSRLLRIRRRYG